MREYLVYAPSYHYDGLFIVKANNAKEAINKVFEQKFAWRNKEIKEDNKQIGYQATALFAKSDFKARSIESLHNEYGGVVGCDNGGWIE